jgi:hypothetical protein
MELSGCSSAPVPPFAQGDQHGPLDGRVRQVLHLDPGRNGTSLLPRDLTACKVIAHRYDDRACGALVQLGLQSSASGRAALARVTMRVGICIDLVSNAIRRCNRGREKAPPRVAAGLCNVTP